MIPDETVERVREAADIVQIVGEFVQLKRTGTDWRGPCPFHQGTHRNFSVSPRKGIYYCFVCHEGGDVFTFVQKRLGMDWPSAVRFVGEKAGVEVREVDTRRDRGEKDSREPFWEVNAAAAEYFRRVLWEEELGAAARAYLAQRDVSRETADRFGLGFAPREIGLMRAHLNTLGYDDARLVEAGLLVQPEETAELRPRFRGRLTFPIYDVQGRTIGFGGRLIGPGEPKYLNSAESPVFSKGKQLYGLNWARHAIRKEDRVLVVEGYFDVVRLAVAGIETVVAPLGTALTEAQAQILRKYTPNVFLLYDSDEAGQKATFRAGLELLREGASVRVVSLPEGEDPDTFVAKQGAAALERQLVDAIDVFDRQVQMLERRGWFADLHKKRRAIDKLLPTIRATADPLTRDIYVGRLADAAGVDKALVAREAEAAADEGRHGRRSVGSSTNVRRGQIESESGPSTYELPPDEPPPYTDEPPRRRAWQPGWKDKRRGDRRREADWASNTAVPRPAGRGVVPTEYNLLRLVLRFPEVLDILGERLSAAELHDANLAEIYAAALDQEEFDLRALSDALSDHANRALVKMQADEAGLIPPDSSRAQIEEALANLLQLRSIREIEEELKAIDAQIQATPPPEREPLTDRRRELARTVQTLRARRLPVAPPKTR